MKQNLYSLSDKEVHIELLSQKDYVAIQMKNQEAKMEYYNTVVQPKRAELVKQLNVLYDEFASKAGFMDYSAVVEMEIKRGKTPEEKDALHKFELAYTDERVKQLYDEENKISIAYNEHFIKCEQEKLYEILRKTCALVEQKDAKGNPLPDNDEWLRLYNDEVDKLKNTAIGRNYGEDMMHYHIGMNHCFFGKEECNAGVMPMVEALQDAGYEVLMFRSGMVQDWPYSRYTQDAPAGRYKAGDHMFWGTQSPMTRLLLLDKDYDFKAVKQMADEAGMRLECIKDDDAEYLEFRFPATRDGSSMNELMEHFAMKHGCSRHAAEEMAVLEPDKFMEVVNEHGGYTVYTDEMLKTRLEELTNSLVNQVEKVINADNSMSMNTFLNSIHASQLFRELVSLTAKELGEEKTFEMVRAAKENMQKQKMHVFLEKDSGILNILKSEDAMKAGVAEGEKYLDLANHVSDVHLYNSPEGKLMMRCKIDGEQQMGRFVSDGQAEMWYKHQNKDWNYLPKLVIAGRIHADMIIRMSEGMGQQQSKGRSL